MAVLRCLLSKGVSSPLLQGEGALGPDFIVEWIDQHAIASAALGKPLIVEEFGVAVNSSSDSADMSSRLAIYQTAYMALNSSISSSAAGAASILRGKRLHSVAVPSACQQPPVHQCVLPGTALSCGHTHLPVCFLHASQP